MARKSGDNLTAKDIIDAEGEDAAAVEMIRDIFRQAGRALVCTIMAAEHPAGGPQEDVLLAACDKAWSSLADKVIVFAMEET